VFWVADVVQDIPGYRAIFGPANGRKRAWIDRVDTVITGMGIIATRPRREVQRAPGDEPAAHEETGDFIRERVVQEEQEGITESALSRLIHGDIGGWLLEREGLQPKDCRLVEDLNRGWTGISGSQLARIARAARPNGAPGIILIAAGPAKADMVWQIIKLGWANEILIESGLAAALKALSSHRSARR
jgi:hypothetical protein